MATFSHRGPVETRDSIRYTCSADDKRRRRSAYGLTALVRTQLLHERMENGVHQNGHNRMSFVVDALYTPPRYTLIGPIELSYTE